MTRSTAPDRYFLLQREEEEIAWKKEEALPKITLLFSRSLAKEEEEEVAAGSGT